MKRREIAAELLLFLTVVLFALVMGAQLFHAIAVVPNWSSDGTYSVMQARELFIITDPGTFFRVASPLALILSIITIGVGWNWPMTRKRWLFVAIGCFAVAEILTWVYFFPRNMILFVTPIEQISDGTMRAVVQEWVNLDWVRSVLTVGGFVAALWAVHWRKEE